MIDVKRLICLRTQKSARSPSTNCNQLTTVEFLNSSPKHHPTEFQVQTLTTHARQQLTAKITGLQPTANQHGNEAMCCNFSPRTRPSPPYTISQFIQFNIAARARPYILGLVCGFINENKVQACGWIKLPQIVVMVAAE